MSTVLIKQGNYWFAQSNLIHVFPCAYRSQNGDYTFDPEARLQTEKNYTNLKPTFNTDGYIIEKNLSTTKISLAGYYFELDLPDTDDIWAETDLYIVLGLKETAIDPDANYKTNILANLYKDSSWNQLDLQATSGEDIFCGLGFTTVIPDSSLKYIKVGTNDNFPITCNKVLSNETNSSITGNLVDGTGTNSVRGLSSNPEVGTNSVVLGKTTAGVYDNCFVYGQNVSASTSGQVVFGQSFTPTKHPGFYIYKEGVKFYIDYTDNSITSYAGSTYLDGAVYVQKLNNLYFTNSNSSQLSSMTFTIPTSKFIFDSDKFTLQTADGQVSKSIYLATGTRLEKAITTTSAGLTSLTTNVGINSNSCGSNAIGQLNIGQKATVNNTNYLNIGNYTGTESTTSNILEVNKNSMLLNGTFNINNTLSLTGSELRVQNGSTSQDFNIITKTLTLNTAETKFTNGTVDITGSQDNALTINSGKIVLTNLGSIIAAQNITASGVVTGQSMNTLSDIRLKTNIKDFVYDKSILDLPIKEFDYISGGHSIGCIAQDLQKIYPNLVDTNNEGYLTVKESKLVYLLIEEVKQLRKELNELKGA